MLCKRAIGFVSDGMWFSARPELTPLDLDRDFAEIEHLFEEEEWPFLRSDIEISLEQPLAVANIARKDGDFAGFFVVHHFGDIGYLNMMIVAQPFRKSGVARPLYFRTLRQLKANGVRSLVVCTTRDSARIIRMLGFRKRQSYTLLARDPGEHPDPKSDGVEMLSGANHEEIVALDARVFGIPRHDWIGSLLKRDAVRFFGIRQDGQLVATICLRPRKNNALCIDMANGKEFRHLEALLDTTLAQCGDRTIECFATTDRELHQALLRRGFGVPDYFVPLGPLTEWTKGNVGPAGRSGQMQCLSWF